ncbi:MAG: tetraacyldisaccharide 4'-kinase [Bacteroidetes bacterium]|nr:tetraacyldisaccharide 4'-kinase [Bacteroidota bacterium]MBS1740180.1 tetraacyldisaccharide 4'-kinase [Bacteroidota bacterium]
MRSFLLQILRLFLYPFALLYGAAVWVRNRLYDTGFFSSVSFSVPIISVGNLSVGGTGKTPHVEYLIRLFQYQYRIATMSRGYKRRTQGFLIADEHTNALKIGDEPMQYYLKFPELIVSVAEERMTGIPSLLQRVPDIDIVLLDDAYQHRSVKPGINILITDFSKPFYTDYILPYGRLRESRKAYQRADVIIISKCPQTLSPDKANEIISKISPLPHQSIFFSTINYDAPYDLFSGKPISLNDAHALIVCCIANPSPFVAHIQQEARQTHVLSYPDHHYFLSKDIEEIAETWKNWNVENKLIVTTEKDATRLHLQREAINKIGATVVVLPIKVELLLEGTALFQQRMISYVEQAVSEYRMPFE